MNILIADDDKTSRTVLKYMLSKFDNVDVFETSNGQEALEMAKKYTFDIVFMDVSMPIMNGTDATERLVEDNFTGLIIAISGDADRATAHAMLKAGAKDYITKPFNVEILRTRVSNYISLIKSKKQQGGSSAIINAFKEQCFPYFTTFKISNDGDLAYFWEFLMKTHTSTCTMGDKCSVNFAVNSLFHIGSILLHMGKKFFIFLETNDTHYYFTITNIADLNKTLVQEIATKELDKAHTDVTVKITSDVLSFKVFTAKQNHTQTIVAAPQKESIAVMQMPEVKIQVSSPKQEENRIYDFLSKYDIAELADCMGDIESTLSVLQYSALDNSEVAVISGSILKISTILSGYNETFNISVALRSLSYDIQENTERFIEKSKAMSGVLMTFISDLKDWQNALFVSGAPSEHFMDDSIIANASTIAGAIKPKQENDEDLNMDDIFGF